MKYEKTKASVSAANAAMPLRMIAAANFICFLLSRRLIGRTVLPAIRRDRVAPDILFCDGAAFRREVVVHDGEHLLVCSQWYAIGPITTVEKSILAEREEQFIELRTVLV